MKIVRNFKSIFKFTAASFVFISSLFYFAACENFLQGEDVKKDIVDAIEYNNADSYTINVEAIPGSGTVKTPATGEVTKKVTDVFPIRFEPSEDHKFIKWEAVVKGMSTGEKAADYIEFENSESLETKVKLKKSSSSIIVIRPVCPPRLSYNFYQGSGEIFPRDSSIEFNFNQNLSQCNLYTSAESYITISNLEQGQYSSTYFNAPVVNGQKLVFRANTSNGFIPVSNTRSITVRIPKESVWYVYDKYLEPIKVTLDSDIVESYLIGTQTSAKQK